MGTKELFCRIVLLDKEVLNPGEEAYAQLRLEEEIVPRGEIGSSLDSIPPCLPLVEDLYQSPTQVKEGRR